MRISSRPDMSISAIRNMFGCHKRLFSIIISQRSQGKFQNLSIKSSNVHLRCTNVTMDGTKVPGEEGRAHDVTGQKP